MRPNVFAAALVALAPCAPVSAGPFASSSALDAAVAEFLGAEVGAKGGAARRVDPRMKLAACAEPLAITWYGRANTTLQVACASRGWRIYVPVETAGAGAENFGSEAIIERGETVSVSYEGQGFTLTRQGEALEAGRRGQWIRIKPLGEKAQPIRAQVLRPGTVRVSAG